MSKERGICTVAFLTVLAFIISAAPLSAAVKTEHPRIWLTDQRKALLIDRLNDNTAAAQNLRNWCDSHINESLSGYTESRAVPTLKAINYALMYQLTGNTSYGDRAIEIIEHILANPYSNYTIDEWIGFDNYYTDRYLIPPVAIVLDWCWDHMSSSRRDEFISQLDTWAADLMTGAPWGWEDPSVNYFYGHCWALLTTAYAIHGHNSNAPGYLEHALLMLDEGIKYTKGEESIWGYMGNYIGRAKGGLWNEGTSYGCVDNEFIGAAILAVRSAETDKANYPESGFPFANEVIQFYIHALYPSNDHTYADGDGASWGGIGATTRVPILLCTELADAQHTSYSKYWLDSYTTRSTVDYKLYHEFMWYPEEASAADYRGEVDLHYLCEGSQVLFWRSGWGTDDTWMAFRIGLLNTAHALNGLGHFIIYDEGYLVTDKAAETGRSMDVGDVHHNVLFIPPPEEKKLYWGASEIEHYEVTSNYLYLAGDMSPVYNAQPDYRHNTVDVKEREFFLIKDEKVLLVMDRGRSFDSSVDKTFQLYLHEQPTSSDDDYIVDNGNTELIIHTAYPDNVNTGFDEYGTPRMRVTTSASELSKTFLHLFKLSESGEFLQNSDVNVSGADMIGTAFVGNTLDSDFMVMFSNNITGGPVTDDPVTADFAGFGNYILAYVLNMQPNTDYYYSDTHVDSSIELVISTSDLGAEGPVTSSPEGVLILGIQPGENPAPPPAPTGTKIH
ncbi:MAG: hypothetical protein GF417_03850 [Candidatus Latescibacteria bacterium]|nr:hypothetical protein [bacterium]MBD3423559.1 hypothetical protein [Candidatus Latescibacterota bacterium]